MWNASHVIRFNCFVKDEDLADVAAKQYYVEYGKEMLPERLLNLLPSYLPESQLQGGRVGLEKWAHLVMNSHKKVCCTMISTLLKRFLYLAFERGPGKSVNTLRGERLGKI